MPKIPLKFGRRRSSGNALDIQPEVPAPTTPSSFRVLERKEKIDVNGNRGSQDRLKQVTRPFNSPLANLRGRSAEELGVGLNRLVESANGMNSNWLLKGSRGSGGTTNSGSSGYYESSSASARHSSSSTLPSSVDAERELEDEELFPRKSKTSPMYQSISANYADDLPPARPSFVSRASRALSFGQKHNRDGSDTIKIHHVPPVPPMPMNGAPRNPERSHSPQRDRSMTTSSYASTAVPSKPEAKLDLVATDFGGDFGSMFDTPKNDRYNAPLPPPPTMGGTFHRTESEPIFPPRTHSRQAIREYPQELRAARDDAGSPYSWDGRNSNEGLMTSSALSSPRLVDGGPPVPLHQNGIAPALLGGSKSGYAPVPERYSSPAPERYSEDSSLSYSSGQERERNQGYEQRQTQLDEENPWAKRVELRDPQEPESVSSQTSGSVRTARLAPPSRKPLGAPSQPVPGASRPGTMSPDSSEGGGSLCGADSRNTTPRAAKLELPQFEEESLFDSSPQGPPSRAIRPGAQHSRTESGTLKKITKEQFERLQRGDASADNTDEEDHSTDEYDDDDDAERANKMVRQRRKQEANMSVYRQQMKKVTGGGPSDLPSIPRPSFDRAAASAPAVPAASLHLGGTGGAPPPDAIRGKDGNDDDEDVPLGILQAHGFPSAGRPPTRAAENDTSQRRASVATSIQGGGAGQGNLPPFARRLPADPYFGSSLVNQSNRESLGMSSAASVYGAPTGMPPMIGQQQPQMGHPGGLVGVIAGEERAKAARRGSPNPATGTYNVSGMPLPNNMPWSGTGMPGMPRTMSMGTMAGPQTYTPSGMGPMGMQMPQMGMPQTAMMAGAQNDQMQQFMQMQMQLMQNMLTMQQQQLGQTPPPQKPTPDYLGVPLTQNRPMTPRNQAPSMLGSGPNQGRAMTMMNPPTRWDVSPSAQRPTSALPNSYAPSGMGISNSGPGPSYTPSIAPSERSNIGMPSRYRPVSTNPNDSGRSQSMTSSLTLQAFGNRQPSPDVPPVPHLDSDRQSKSTIRLIDKPKGAPKVTTKTVAADEDDDEAWAEMRKKRDDKKKFRFGKRAITNETSLGDIYQSYE